MVRDTNWKTTFFPLLYCAAIRLFLLFFLVNNLLALVESNGLKRQRSRSGRILQIYRNYCFFWVCSPRLVWNISSYYVYQSWTWNPMNRCWLSTHFEEVGPSVVDRPRKQTKVIMDPQWAILFPTQNWVLLKV